MDQVVFACTTRSTTAWWGILLFCPFFIRINFYYHYHYHYVVMVGSQHCAYQRHTKHPIQCQHSVNTGCAAVFFFFCQSFLELLKLYREICYCAESSLRNRLDTWIIVIIQICCTENIAWNCDVFFPLLLKCKWHNRLIKLFTLNQVLLIRFACLNYSTHWNLWSILWSTFSIHSKFFYFETKK